MENRTRLFVGSFLKCVRRFSKQTKYLDEEYCILVDEHDNYTGKASKRDCHTWSKIEAGETCTIENYVSCHPLHVADEMETEPNNIGVRKAAQRKLTHELGLKENIPLEKFRFIARMLYKAKSDEKWGEHELDYIFFVRANLVPLPDLDEVESTMYVSKNGLPLLLKKSQTDERLKFTPWFTLLAKNFLYDWWDKLERLDEITDNKKIYKLS